MLEKRVLIVDERHVIQMLEYTLAVAGYGVLSALDGHSAMRQAIDKQPSCIILSVALPDLDAYDVCRQLRDHKKTKNALIIMVCPENVAPAAIAAGAHDCLSKPFRPVRVVECVNNLLASSTEHTR